jgi:hypothetical protein
MIQIDSSIIRQPEHVVRRRSVALDFFRLVAPQLVLAPCGICQERLSLWGKEVEVAIAVPGKPDE